MSNPNPQNQPSETARKRPYASLRHNLYEINLERKTAFCTICGYTAIHVSKSRTKQTSKVFCISRFRELNQAQINSRRKKRHSKPGWKPRHSLSEIDTEKKTANCAVCGPTAVWENARGESTRYICAKQARAYGRNYRRSESASRVSNPLIHVISEINEEKKTATCSRCGPVEIYIWQGGKRIGRRCSNASVKRIPAAQKIRKEINTNLINRYKIEHGCKRCGYNANLNFLDLQSREPDKKVPKIEKLLQLPKKDLIHELENCEVQCIYCRSLVNAELSWKSSLQ